MMGVVITHLWHDGDWHMMGMDGSTAFLPGWLTYTSVMDYLQAHCGYTVLDSALHFYL